MNDGRSHRQGTLRLPDGRRMTFVDTGPRDGLPVLYCHGAIGTPLRDSVNLQAIVARLGIRHIAVNRPGFAGSDPHRRRTVVAFAADVRALADALALERFSVVGVSAGGPYALAVARELGDRVAGAAVCSSLSPLCAPHRTPGMTRRIRLALTGLAAAPGTCRVLGDAVLPVLRRHPELLHRVIAAHAAPGERARLAEPAERLAAATSFLDATSYGVSGMVEDYLTYSRGWGFRPEQVEPEVHVWHGACDPLVPVEHALQLAVSLPACRIFVDPDEGHHFFRRRLEEILTVLLSPDRGPAEMSLAGAHALLRQRPAR
ncbi:MAG TPA: alpha/beta hydrolase [Solirubrobacteraceae bacterium]|jgi:pimeloyl-ACP methyl ester carboxylesterase|nr:alpha/beta hydrolase [Solirubrobacteraceae bacterium]